MYLTQHQTATGPRWAVDGRFLPRGCTLSVLLGLPQSQLAGALAALATDEGATGAFLPPIDPAQEVWAAGVTYLRSRDARKAESAVGDVYQRVYEAERPEVFFKAPGWRVVGHGNPVRIRKDSHWNVPEPEMVLVINSRLEIVGYCAGNDVSSRDIEGANPLYLPQAKIYNGSCALGPGITLADGAPLRQLPITLTITRDGRAVFQGETTTAQMKRTPEELARWLGLELDLPFGVLLMTGTGLVPPETFSLAVGDTVQITVGSLTLENRVES